MQFRESLRQNMTSKSIEGVLLKLKACWTLWVLKKDPYRANRVVGFSVFPEVAKHYLNPE